MGANSRGPKRARASSKIESPSDNSGESADEAQIVSSDEGESSEPVLVCSVCDMPIKKNEPRLRHLKCHKKCGERARGAVQYHFKKVGGDRQKQWKTSRRMTARLTTT